MLKIANLEIVNTDNKIVKFRLNFSHTFNDGKKYLILGENGSGKSTLLNAIEGKVPYKGKIDFDGEDLIDKNIFSFPSINLPQNISIEDYLIFLGLDKNQQEPFLNLMVLSSKKRCLIKSLTTNECNRLKLIFLFKQSYKYILLDEISNGIQLIEVKEIVSLIFKNFSSSTIIMADHHIDKLKELFDEIIVLKNGKIEDIIAQKSKDDYRVDKLFFLNKSYKEKNSIIIKQRIKTNYLFLFFSAIIVLIINLFSVLSIFQDYSSTTTSLPLINLRSSNNEKLDLTNSKSIKKALYNPEINKLDLDNISIFYLPEGESKVLKSKNSIKLLAGLDSYGRKIKVIGKNPNLSNEIAVSNDLKKYVSSQNELIVHLNNKSYYLNVVGYFYGTNSISLSHSFFESFNFIPSNLPLIAKINDETIKLSLANKNIVFAPSEESINDIKNITFHSANAESTFNSLKINIDDFIVSYSSDNKDISIYVSTDYALSLLHNFLSDYEVQLIYDNFDDLKSDRELFLKRGYIVYSNYTSNINSLKIVLNIIIALCYIMISTFMAFFYLIHCQNTENICSKNKSLKIDLCLFLSIIAIFSLPYLCYIPFVILPTFSYIIFYLSYILAFISAPILALARKKVRK